MSNANVTINMVAKEALMIAHEKASFIGSINRSYDDYYAKTGGKIGSALRIKNPNQYSVTTGSRVMEVQDQDSTTQSITMASQYHVDMRFNSAELALDIDKLSAEYIRPAVSVLMSKIDGECLVQATKDTFNTAGTAGTIVGTVTSGFSDTSALGKARAKINQGLAPSDNRSIQLDSVTMASVSNGIKGLFLPSNQVTKAFTEGFIARSAMADFYENERTWSVANPADVAGEIDEQAETNFVQGATVVHMDGFTTAANLLPGMVFEWEGVYACHPETKQAYSHLQQFVVVSVANPSSGDADITFSPAIYTTGAKQNVCTSTGAALTWTSTGQDGKDITFFGSASTAYRQNLMYHKDAFTFVTADLPLMGGADKCSRIQQDGIALRVWQDGDIRNDELLMRIDILWGFKTIRPYWASRLSN